MISYALNYHQHMNLRLCNCGATLTLQLRSTLERRQITLLATLLGEASGVCVRPPQSPSSPSLLTAHSLQLPVLRTDWYGLCGQQNINQFINFNHKLPNSYTKPTQVRIWYQNQQLLLPGQTLDSASQHITFSFIYVAHPRPVTGFSWRETSRCFILVMASPISRISKVHATWGSGQRLSNKLQRQHLSSLERDLVA